MSKIDEIIGKRLYNLEVIEYVRSINEETDNIEEIQVKLESMLKKYNFYLNHVTNLEKALGDYLPDQIKIFLINYRLAIWQGKYARAEILLGDVAVAISKHKARRKAVLIAKDKIDENYQRKLSSLDNEESISYVKNMYYQIIVILRRVLKDEEDRNILTSLVNIKFESIDEINCLVQDKTKKLYLKVNPSLDDSILYRQDDYDKDKVYSTKIEKDLVSSLVIDRNNFYVHYKSLYSLLKQNKIDKNFLINLAMNFDIPLCEEEINSDEIMIINSIANNLKNRKHKEVVRKRIKWKG